MSPYKRGSSLALGLLLTHLCHAQDRRHVTEPVTPPTCITLPAYLTAPHHALADSDEDKLDTARLQQALDHCSKGKAVELSLGKNGTASDATTDPTKTAFLTGPITIPAGVTLLIDRGITLFASRDARLYDLQPNSCGIVSKEGRGCKTIITITDAPHSAIIGPGSIDGRGGSKILHTNTTWWDLANDARGGGRQQVPQLINVFNSDDFTLYNLTLRNSANFHVTYKGGHGFTVWGLKIDTPANARNTDGIDPSGSSDITVTRSFIRTGDDNIAIKGSSGGITHMSVIDNHFYYGHGMSIGSETYDGVSDLLVQNLTLDGTTSGIRIKSNSSRGGLVNGATYSDLCIRDSKMPIAIDTDYNNPGPHTDRLPDYKNIILNNVQIYGGGKIIIAGLDDKHRTTVQLNNVLLDDPTRYKISAEHAVIAYGPGPANFTIPGPDVYLSGKPTNTKPTNNCQDRFIPFPTEPQ